MPGPPLKADRASNTTRSLPKLCRQSRDRTAGTYDVNTTTSAQPDSAPLDLLRVTDRTEAEQPLEGHTEDVECPRPVRVRAERVNVNTGEMVTDPDGGFDIPCGCWACPVCGPSKRRRYVAHYSDVFSEREGVRFVTLTLDPKSGLAEGDSRKFILHAWSKWRKRINRKAAKTGHRLDFMRVVEFQSNGYAHLHAVLSAPGVEDTELASDWFAVGGGVVVDVAEITGDREAIARRIGYTVKYALKDATEADSPRGRHYVDSSQGIGYESAPARARRRAYVEEIMQDEPKTGNELGPDEVRVYTTDAGHSARPADPDKITPEEAARFDAILAGNRSRKYRSKGSDGYWYLHEQHEDGTRTKTRLPGYKSLYEQRTETEDGGSGPDYTAGFMRRKT